MTGDVDRAFDALEALMASVAFEAVSRQPEAYVQQIENFIDQYLRGLFPELAQMIRGEMMAAPSFSPDWAPLDLFYQDRKEFKKGVYGFARWSRRSQAAIFGLRGVSRQIFGSPKATITVTMGQGKLVYVRDGRNRWRFGKGSVDQLGVRVGGRFARSLSDFQNLRASIVFEPVEGVEMIGAKINRSWVESQISKPFAAFEFGRKYQPARPLLVPYLKWKLGDQLQQELREKLRAL